MDRLILELKLPPQDAFFKLLNTLEEVNNIIAAHSILKKSSQNVQRLSPELGNVCFASGQHGWSFTLESFADLYCSRHPDAVFEPADLAKRLWGEWYYNEDTHAISKKKAANATRTFVQYVLEPLYKIYAHVIGESAEDLTVLLKGLGVKLKNKELHLDPRPLLRLTLSRFFGRPRGFVEMIVKHVPSPVEGYYTVNCCRIFIEINV